ncbi:hypothetical protein BJP40_25735 [Streptomyces sp. CC53]|nr:hypothetical protein BJP40_25735 [Streptomyces sp. CC53]
MPGPAGAVGDGACRVGAGEGTAVGVTEGTAVDVGGDVGVGDDCGDVGEGGGDVDDGGGGVGDAGGVGVGDGVDGSSGVHCG